MKKELKQFEIVIENGSLKGCLVYHESVKSYFEEKLKTQKQKIFKKYIKEVDNDSDYNESLKKDIKGKVRNLINKLK